MSYLINNSDIISRVTVIVKLYTEIKYFIFETGGKFIWEYPVENFQGHGVWINNLFVYWGHE